MAGDSRPVPGGSCLVERLEMLRGRDGRRGPQLGKRATGVASAARSVACGNLMEIDRAAEPAMSGMVMVGCSVVG